MNIEDRHSEVFGRVEEKKDQLSQTDVVCIDQLFERYDEEYGQNFYSITTLIDILDQIEEILDYPDH